MQKKNKVDIEEKRKLQIVQAAYEVIAGKGYNNFTIDDIAAQAGLSKGGVLYYFDSKYDILIYLLEKIQNIIEQNIKMRSDKYRTPERKLKAIIIAYIVTAKRHPAFYRVFVDFWAQISINQRIKDINSRIYERMCSEIKRVIDEGISMNVFNNVESSSLSCSITSMITNLAIQWTFDNSQFNLDRVVRNSISMVMAYLKK
jgi:AcrR family transcriptional regulator